MENHVKCLIEEGNLVRRRSKYEAINSQIGRHFNRKAMHFKEFSGVSETTITDSHILALNPVLNSFLIPS
jgi:hypothetical protein